MTEVEQGIKWLRMYGKKSFKDHTGEWVEVRCSVQLDLFGGEGVVIPHLLDEGE